MPQTEIEPEALSALAPCLMTGATGQVGSECLARLNAAGVAPMVLLRRPMPPGAWRGARVVEIAGDLEALAAGETPAALREALARTRTLIHLAARVNLAGRGAEQMRALNERGTLALFELARECGVRRFVHVRTVGTIGCAREPRPLDEDAVYNLGSFGNPYFDTKRRAEEELLRRWAADPARTELVIANPSIVLGRQVSLRRLARAHRRPPPRPGAWPLPLVCFWFGGGLTVVDLRDAADGILRVAARGRAGRRYILGGDNLTVRELMEAAHRALGTGRPIVRLPLAVVRASAEAAEGIARVTGRRARWNRSLARLIGVYWFVDSGRAERELGWSHRPFAETLADLREWMLAPGRDGAAGGDR
jgi:dihydroflavonol-4-reductase